MTVGDFRLEVGLDSTATDAFVKWTDFTRYLTDGSYSRGRSYELDAVEAGEASWTLDNGDGSLTPGRDWLVHLQENFGEVAPQRTHTSSTAYFHQAGSGLWYVANTSSPSTSYGVTGGPRAGGGFTASAPALALTSNTVQVGKHVPFSPETQFRVTVKARVNVTGAVGATTFNIWAYATDVVGDGLGTLLDSWASSSITGAEGWVTHTGTFTVPTLAAQPTYKSMRLVVRGGVVSASDTGKPIVMEVAYFRVETVNPYAGKLVPRKPVRAYTIHDDNWLHFESVNASVADLDAPRWTPVTPTSHWWETGQQPPTYAPGNIVKAFDSGLSGGVDVFEFRPPAGISGSTLTYRAGLDGDSDVIHVKAGETLTMDADIRVTATGGGLQTWIVIKGYDYDGIAVAANTSALVAVTTWTHVTATLTASQDMFVRPEVVAFQRATVRGANFKLRKNGVGVATVSGVASGVFPEFRGFTEKWTATTPNIGTAVTVVSCTDGMSALNQPILSKYRTQVIRSLAENRIDYTTPQVHYWSLTDEEDGAMSASPTYEITDFSSRPVQGSKLNVTVTATAPETGGFTSNKTMPHADGMDSSGGFTNLDSVATVGAVLRVDPNLFKHNDGYHFALALWWDGSSTPTGLPRIFNGYDLNGVETIGLTVNADLTLNAFFKRDGVTEISGNTVSQLVPGQPNFIWFGFIASPNSTSSIDVFLNGNATSETFTGLNNNKPLPSLRWFNIGGARTATVGSNMFRGTINHVMLAVTGSLHMSSGWDGHWNYAQDDSDGEGERIARLLDAAEWQGSVSLDPSLSQLLPARWENGTNALSELSQAAEDGGGTFLIGPAGEAVLQNRQRRMAAPIRWTLGEWTNGLTFELDEARIYNVVQVERSTGMTRTVEDAASKAKYRAKELKLTRNVSDPDELVDAGMWVLHRYGESGPRVESLSIDSSVFNPATDQSMIALAHGVTVSDRILLENLPATAPAYEWDFFVEGLSVDIERDGGTFKRTVTLNISDASTSQAWVLEDSVSGVLGANECILVY